MTDITHIVATRLNLGKGNDAEWTRDRTKLMRQFCLPGIKAQTFKDFRWIILVDRETPAILLEECLSDLPITYVRVPDFQAFQKNWWMPFVGWCREHVKTEWLATTRLDSDDVLHPDYLADIDAAAEPKTELLAFPGGYVRYLKTQTTYMLRNSSTNFQTLVEKTAECKTAYCAKHGNIRHHFPFRVLEQFPRWLVVRHGNNWHYDRKKQGPPNLPKVGKDQYAKEFGFLAGVGGGIAD